MSADVNIVHFIPGRVRFRAQRVKQSAQFADEVKQRLSALDAIKRVEVNAATGSVLVEYDRRRIADAQQQQVLADTVKQLFPSLDVDKLRRFL